MAFADVMLASLGRGATTCSELQEAARAMVLESGGACSKVTRAIARIGSHGKFPGNAERDLFRALALPVVTQDCLAVSNLFFLDPRFTRILQTPKLVFLHHP